MISKLKKKINSIGIQILHSSLQFSEIKSDGSKYFDFGSARPVENTLQTDDEAAAVLVLMFILFIHHYCIILILFRPLTRLRRGCRPFGRLAIYGVVIPSIISP